MDQDMGSDPRMSLKMTDRMSRKDCFEFYCGPSVPCFTECCRKLDLALTPYDVLRLCTRLEKSPSEFQEDYTVIKTGSRHGFPEVFLKMAVDVEKLCPFVSKDGCTVYEDRPGACRIYPLGRASSKNRSTDLNEEFYFVVRESHCRGFEQTKNWAIDEWLSDQDLEQYNRVNDQLMELYMLGFRRGSVQFSTQQLQMFMMACYNLRKFREFIFKSSFLTKFDLSSEDTELMRENDTILLEFSFKWLKFALFGIPALKLKS
jgi:Fe-S-cluster containining protein